MAHSAHLITNEASKAPIVTIRDEQGATITEWPSSAELGLDQTDGLLREAGWIRSGDWTTADDGWTAPVRRS
ncbi:hypothetical protein GCM10009854_50140 [Saccharopolyspora halophila]|uniref:Uncharacterized protein n=1 Tax=Saccharopolyspora halophila TaxID=405551 RepID=A0ABN3H0J1_9PSEU